MVLFVLAVLGSLLRIGGAASPVGWQHQYNDLERSRETDADRSFTNQPAISLMEYSQGCTVDSFDNTTNFILREYQIETITGADNNTQLRGTFSVENPGSGDTYRLYHVPISVGGGVWSVCRAGEDAPLPEELARCQYVLEQRNHRIGFRFDWYCDGKDPDHR